MCGILGIVDNKLIQSSYFTKLLKKLQHRGQESFGISWVDKEKLHLEKYQNMIQHNKVKSFESNIIIGHNRYSTSGKSKNKLISNTNISNSKENNEQSKKETQPFYGNSSCGEFVLVHNGNVPEYKNLNLIKNINIEEINSDTEYIVKLIESLNYGSWCDIFKYLLNKIKRAFCLLVMTKNEIYVVRDKYGVRPLSLGFNETGWCVSSESCVFDDFNFLRDVRPGEVLKMNVNGIQTLHLEKKEKKAYCLFEYIYFLNENSYSDGYQVSQLRYKYGEQLAREDIKNNFHIENPLVVGSPSTGIPSGKGYADKMRYEYQQVLKKNNIIGRTFILENNKKRDNACKKKYYLDVEKIKDRNIILVDDSLVRGTTMKNLVIIFRESGAKSIHIRIAAPPIKYPCYFGVDIPTKEELIANDKGLVDNKEISENVSSLVGADSLYYLKIESIKNIMKEHFNNLCSGCFDNNYNEKLDW